MGLASFWSSITGPRVREITPRKNNQGGADRRPATSSGVRTVRKTPSFEEGDDRDLNLVESLLTTNIIEPPSSGSQSAFEEKKIKRRSRGLSLSKAKNEDGAKKRRSIFGGSKDTEKKEEVPEVPTLPTLSAIYSAQAPHRLNDLDRPSTAAPAFGRSKSPRVNDSAQGFGVSMPKSPTLAQGALSDAPAEVFELPAELPASPPAKVEKATTKTEAQVKKSRRRSFGEVLSGKRPKVDAQDDSKAGGVPPTPALPKAEPTQKASHPVDKTFEPNTALSRRNSNASVASKASKMSRKSKRKSWWQRKPKDEDEVEALPPMPVNIPTQSKETPASSGTAKGRKASSPEKVDLEPFPAVLTAQPKDEDNDDAASIRTTRSQKATARATPAPAPSGTKATPKPKKQRPVSTASHTRRRRRSWWTSSNPDESDDDSNPLPPVPLLIRSTTTSPDSSPTYSVRGDDLHAPRPRPVSTATTLSSSGGGYVPRAASKSFLISTTPLSPDVRATVRKSLHAYSGSGELDAGFENDRGTYCLSAEQQREWEKLKHLMAVMERRRDVTRKTFGEASVAEMFPAVPKGEEGDEEREGVKFSNRDALAALEVGVAR